MSGRQGLTVPAARAQGPARKGAWILGSVPRGSAPRGDGTGARCPPPWVERLCRGGWRPRSDSPLMESGRLGDAPDACLLPAPPAAPCSQQQAPSVSTNREASSAVPSREATGAGSPPRHPLLHPSGSRCPVRPSGPSLLGPALSRCPSPAPPHPSPTERALCLTGASGYPLGACH